MKLLIFSKDNCIPHSSQKGVRAIRINRKAGIICYSKALTDLLAIKDKERTYFALDEEKNEW